jgi:hypothetical protein
MLRTRYLLALAGCCLAAGPGPNDPPALVTVTVHYQSCSDCADFTVDSGTVVVPPRLRAAYVDAMYRHMRRYGRTLERVQRDVAARGYVCGDLRAATDASYDSLYTPPGFVNFDFPSDEEAALQVAYWQRRYRLTGTVVGLDRTYPVFRVQKAVRLADKED